MPRLVESLAVAAPLPIAAWRRRMGIEPTARFGRATGFEDQGDHQTPIASVVQLEDMGFTPLALDHARFKMNRLQTEPA